MSDESTTLWISRDALEDLRIAAATQGLSMRDLASELIEQTFGDPDSIEEIEANVAEVMSCSSSQ